MMPFILGICFFIAVIVVCFFILSYLSKEEKNYLEVSDNYLKNIGKSYTKDQFANWAFYRYEEIKSSEMSENYEFLRDSLSDELYNKCLLKIKNNKDRNVKEVTEGLKPVFYKLVNLKVQGTIEIAKVWMRYSYINYIKDVSPIPEGQSIIGDRIVAGNTNRQESECMLTFVKARTEHESILCPTCGFLSDIVDKSKCVRCGGSIATKQYHWVLTSIEDKVIRNK